jgi:hypothetical protein
MYFLRSFARRRSYGLHAEFVVESRLFLLESPPSLVELVEAGTLPFMIVPGLRGLLTSESVRLLTVKLHQPSHEFTFGVSITFIPYPLVLTPLV